jgi:simple sugar transport system permease protein
VANASAFAAFLERSSVLALCALGAALAFRGGSFNLGGEGQAYLGGLSAVLAALAVPEAPFPLGFALGLAAGTAGGALAAVPAALGKRLAGADALLSTFLTGQAIALAVDWLVGGPLRDPESNLMATRAIARAALPPRASLPAGLAPFAALAAAVALAWLFSRSRRGREIDLYGGNPAFARSVGLPVGALAFWPLVGAGALHGLAGAFIALGAGGRAIRGMTGGVAWSAIGASLVAGHAPVMVLPASLLFGWLDSGARRAAVVAGLPFEAATLVKAAVLLLATARLAGIGRPRRTRPGDGAGKRGDASVADPAAGSDVAPGGRKDGLS